MCMCEHHSEYIPREAWNWFGLALRLVQSDFSDVHSRGLHNCSSGNMHVGRGLVWIWFLPSSENVKNLWI